jgi:hypothetical protein
MQKGEALEEGGLEVDTPTKNPQHHVFPQNARDKRWYRERGINVDKYVVNMYEGEHQGLHGGGNFRLGRTWEKEWNREIRRRMQDAEYVKMATGGGRLTATEIEAIGRDMMKDYGIDHLPFQDYKKGWLPE